MAPPCVNLSFIWVGIFVLEPARMSHAGMAAVVGPAKLRGMVDPHVELVFAKRALRHAAAASATIFSTMLGRPELWRSWTRAARFPETTRSRPI